MKKKIREQLRLLAQQLIEKEETFSATQIKNSVLDLYNQLVILEYLENQIELAPQEPQMESLDSKSFREENWFTEPEPVPQPTHKEDLVEPLMEKIKDIVAQMPEESERLDQLLNSILPSEKHESLPEEVKPTPSIESSLIPEEDSIEGKSTPFEESSIVPEEEPIEFKSTLSEESSIIPEEEPTVSEVEAVPSEVEPKIEDTYIKNELEEFASAYQQMPEFERKDPQLFPPSTGMRPAIKNDTESKVKSINDSINKGLSVGLNDRLAFIKHLFEGETEDYTRVLSQINTMGSYEEAERFIMENVKPDYHNWENKDVYSDRFMHIIQKRFV